jgi:hypothetical protein
LVLRENEFDRNVCSNTQQAICHPPKRRLIPRTPVPMHLSGRGGGDALTSHQPFGYRAAVLDTRQISCQEEDKEDEAASSSLPAPVQNGVLSASKKNTVDSAQL